MRDYVDYAYYVSLGLSLGLFFFGRVRHSCVCPSLFLYVN